MEKIKTLSNPIVKDGVQAIILVGREFNFFDQEYIIIQDHDDRGRGDGILMYGLPGGAIEGEESSKTAIFRELEEEIAFNPRNGKYTFEKFGCYTKLRPNGFTNNNHLFVLRLKYVPRLETNDFMEVSKVHRLTLREIVNLAIKKQVHEGSIRLIIKFLKLDRCGSLNDCVVFNGITF